MLLNIVQELTGSQSEISVIEFDRQISSEMSTEIIRKILPENIQAPTSFEIFGNACIINLKPKHLDFRFSIGKSNQEKLFWILTQD